MKVIDGLTLPERIRALLRPGELVEACDGHCHRLPRYFYEVDSWAAAKALKLTAHFTLAELTMVDCREARPLLEEFPHYVPCAITVLARYLEEFRTRAEGPVLVAANGGYRSPAHAQSRVPGPHAWAAAANLYCIGESRLDDEKTVERFAKVAEGIGEEVRVKRVEDHLHLDLGFLQVVPWGFGESAESPSGEPGTCVSEER